MGDRPGAKPVRPVPLAGLTSEVIAALGLRVPGPRSYPGRDSPEHAQRLLRRAENVDRPGEETLRRLVAARGYDIERMPEPHGECDNRAWCSLYEHAFLLEDDSELCLYELEHDLTPDRRLVCEVYPNEAAAGRAARRLVRGHGAAD